MGLILGPERVLCISITKDHLMQPILTSTASLLWIMKGHMVLSGGLRSRQAHSVLNTWPYQWVNSWDNGDTSSPSNIAALVPIQISVFHV